jgi:hypothetical protein
MTFRNSKKEKFILQIPQSGLEDSNIAQRSKFNFSYFVADQPAGQSFDDWNNNSGANTLLSLIKKIQEYTREPLQYWQRQKIGRQNILEVYGDFPKSKSDFTHPASVPHDVMWARFRLASKIRLIGFVVPDKFKGKLHGDSNSYFDTNTFYIVFLDEDHKFYKTEKK